MDKLKTDTFIVIVDQYYDIEISNGIKNRNNISRNIVFQLKKIKTINDLYNDQELYFIVTNIVNSRPNRMHMKEKKIKHHTYKMKGNSKLQELIHLEKKNDNQKNRDKLKKNIVSILDGNNYNQIELIYKMYFDSIINNDLTILNILIDCDIDVNAIDDNGNTALHYAIIYNRLNIIMILLQNDIKSIKNKNGNKPIDLLKKNIVNLNDTDKKSIIDVIEYRKNKTFKMNTSVSLFGKHNNLININSEEELYKLKGKNGILVFYMVTCGWCKKMQNDIKMLCKRGTKVYIMESKFVTQNIRNKYDISGFPTIYLLKDNKEIKYNNSDRSYKTFEKILRN